MLIQDEITINGIESIDLVSRSIERLQIHEPPEGYYLAFSGGKDSQCIYHLAKEAGVKFDAHYNITGLDPPELVYFIRKNYPDVICDMPKKSMWRLIEKKGLPTKLSRFCCQELKEGGGEGRIVITGVRWAESVKRKATRTAFEIFTKKKEDRGFTNDNDEARRMFENCIKKGKFILNPIIDWSTDDVWEYIHSRSLQYCCLYDQGFNRLGCIGCPMGGQKGMLREFGRYPKYRDMYVRAIERFMVGYAERCKKKGKIPFRDTAEEWMHWWIFEQKKMEIEIDGQEEID